MTDLRKPLGKRIAQIRKQKGYTQEKLAEKLNIARNSLSNIESGRSFMSFKILQKLVDIFQVAPYEFFIFDKTEPSKIIFSQVSKELNCLKNDKDKLMLLFEFINKLK